MEELIPGVFLMVDVVSNPVKECIVSKHHYPHYLTISDVTSRLFVPMGLRDKTAELVFKALQDWAISFGPGTEINLYMLTHIHGDYDPTFRSEEFRRLTANYNIKVTFAAPRHQEQNGIHEANWRNVRNLAFAMMNQA